MEQEIRVLSLWEPWASLCSNGFKTFETRGWQTSYRGAVLIHATMRVERHMFYHQDFHSVLKLCGYETHTDLPLGHALAIVDLVHVHITTEIAPYLSDRELAFGDYNPNRFAFEFQRLRKLPEPVPLIGKQTTLWRLPRIAKYEESIYRWL